CGPAQECDRRIEEPEARLVRVSRIADRRGHHVAQLGQELAQLRRVAAKLGANRGRVAVAHERAEDLRPRPERRRPAPVPAARPQDARATRLGDAGELVRQARLADPGLARDQRDVALADQRLLECVLERAELIVVADQQAATVLVAALAAWATLRL